MRQAADASSLPELPCGAIGRLSHSVVMLVGTHWHASSNVACGAGDNEQSLGHSAAEGSAAQAAASQLQEKYVAWQQRLDNIVASDPQVRQPLPSARSAFLCMTSLLGLRAVRVL